MKWHGRSRASGLYKGSMGGSFGAQRTDEAGIEQSSFTEDSLGPL
jgi:hypothetical protein